MSSPLPVYTDTDHIIFIVHGIGQRLDKFKYNIGRLCANTKWLRSEKGLDVGPNIHYIPVDWHHRLHALDSAEGRMRSVTLPTVPLMRLINNEYLGDLIYYLTIFHGRIITEFITSTMNEFYDDLMRKHPSFKGKISILGHSLGGIICYDILCHQNLDEPLPGRALTLPFEYPKLKFMPNYLITMGSPLSAVMIMRGQQYHEYVLPSGVRLLNVFHPYDPFGYRLEPLIDARYADMEPVIVEHWNDKKLHIYIQEQYVKPYLPDLTAVTSRMPSLSLPEAASSMLAQLSPGDVFQAVTRPFAAVMNYLQSLTTGGNSAESPDTPTARKRKPQIRRSSRLKRRRMADDIDSSELDGEDMIMAQFIDDEVSDEEPSGKSPRHEGNDRSPDAVTFEQPSGRPTLFHEMSKKEEREEKHKWKADYVRREAHIEIGPSNDDTTPIATGGGEQTDKAMPLNDDGRLDYMLQINMLENMSHEYLAGFPAHFSYWNHKDLAFLILKLSESQ